MSVRAAVVLFVLSSSIVASAAPENETGVEGLCRSIERLAASELAGAPGVRIETLAEGVAMELSDAVDARCRALLGRPATEGVPWRLRLRLRVARPLLLAVVEVLEPTDDGRERSVLTEVADVPLGPALETWLGTASVGIESWLAGAVPGRVLALCGGDANGDGIAEVLFVTTTQVLVMRWDPGGFEVLERRDLPLELRPLARAPGASAACQSTDQGLRMAFGIHDRNRGLSLTFHKGKLSEPLPLAGIPIAWQADAPVLAQGVPGRGLVRWRGKELAGLAWVPSRPVEAPKVVGVTQDGAPVVDDRLGAALTSGTGIAAVDLDGDGVFELVRTRPLWPGSSSADRLIVTSIDEPTVVKLESTAITGVLGPVGAVAVGPWWRVLAVRHVEGRSMLYALGRRHKETGP